MQLARLVPELLCSNIEHSLDFYVGLAGFRIAYDRPEDGFAYLDRDGAQLMLEQAAVESADERVWWTAGPERPYGRGINFQIEVDAVDALLARFEAAGWPLFRPLEEQWYRKGDLEVGNRQFLVQDPDGYLLRFSQDLGERPCQRDRAL